MKISYKHIVKHFNCVKPSIEELSEKLLQLGHEHEIENGIFDMEITPNRGDCFSLLGLLRDLSVFYDINKNFDFFDEELPEYNIDFENKAENSCPRISFLKVEIGNSSSEYNGVLKEFFDEMGLKKINIFTDISNYISYELGQPTHCYDERKINNKIQLEVLDGNYEFKTLLDTNISLSSKNLVFTMNNEIINLAGVIGNMNTSCSKNTKSVIIECAYFNPEDIIGKSLKYDVNSEAAHKFERGIDPISQESTLRRFLKIIQENALIKSAELYSAEYKPHKMVVIPCDIQNINKILGTKICKDNFTSILQSLGFEVIDNNIHVPSYRSDINTQNDIAEEIARSIGYNNIKSQKIIIKKSLLTKKIYNSYEEKQIKNFLINKGFFEVINNPFVREQTKKSIKVDNPLDSNREYLRTNLKNSLLDNLIYNERRQQDSIKIFEISDVYLSDIDEKKRILGIICSGKEAKNYKQALKKINIKYLKDVLLELSDKIDFDVQELSRDDLNTKISNPIIYMEIDIENITKHKLSYVSDFHKPYNVYKKYTPISDFPSSSRDLSFSIKSPSSYYELQELILQTTNDLIKEIYIFDFYVNEKSQEIKIGFRFIFQSKSSTITDIQVNKIMSEIISLSTKIKSVEIPGLVV